MVERTRACQERNIRPRAASYSGQRRAMIGAHASLRSDVMRWQAVAPRLAVGLASLALLGGCSAGATPSLSVTPTPTPALVSPSTSLPPGTPASPASTSTPTASSPASATAAATASPTGPFVGQVVTTLADDGLRVRSQPRVSADSDPYEPLLPHGTLLYVLGGPVSASGYAWYEVAPLTSRTLPSGWVASAGRDGEPWIATGAFDCPPVPTDFRSLAALPPGVGLACFPRVPITVQARLLSCYCDIDGAWYTPRWFTLNENPDLLVAPDVTSVPPNMADWFGLNLDPTGQQPAVVPIGQVVQVTGIFDHPAAASCTRTEMDGEPVPTQECRLEFAVTQLLVQGP
jgi:hypothetical protein